MIYLLLEEVVNNFLKTPSKHLQMTYLFFQDEISYKHPQLSNPKHLLCVISLVVKLKLFKSLMYKKLQEFGKYLTVSFV